MNAIKTFHAFKKISETEIVVKLSGELDLSVATELVEDLQSVIGQQDRALLLDLKDLQYIDSTGIGIIVSILKSRTAMKAPFGVVNTPPKIKRLFDLTGISKHLLVSTASTSTEGKEQLHD